MRFTTPRAGRWPLAFLFSALAALGACADEPVAPRSPSALPSKEAGVTYPYLVVFVRNTSGGTEVGSLRWAAAQVAANGGGEIKFDSTLAGDTIALDAELVLQGTVYMSALQNKGIVISGKNQHRVMRSVGPYLNLWNVTVTEGSAEYGSAIVAPRLFLDYSNVQNNRGPGSAVYAETSLYLGNATVSGNATGGPAVEYASGAQVELNHATIAYNSAGPGLGVRSYPSYATQVVLHNSIISNNGTPLLNCNSSFGFVYRGTNISNDWSCGEVGMVVADPLLMPLANNGGPVLTHAIPHTSPAYNTGVITGHVCRTYDARYVKRDLTKCDVGAFEFNDSTKVTITIDNVARLNTNPAIALLTGTVTCTRDETINLALELHQAQRVGKDVVDVHAAAVDSQVACTPGGNTWARKMTLSEGAWQTGGAQATAQTFNIPEWVAPASAANAVRIARK